jgi:hypothetical protein
VRWIKEIGEGRSDAFKEIYGVTRLPTMALEFTRISIMYLKADLQNGVDEGELSSARVLQIQIGDRRANILY